MKIPSISTGQIILMSNEVFQNLAFGLKIDPVPLSKLMIDEIYGGSEIFTWGSAYEAVYLNLQHRWGSQASACQSY